MSILERIDQHSHIPSDRRVVAPPFPRSVKIEVTARCNLRCAWCGLASSKRTKGDMSLELYKQLIPALQKAGMQELGLFYLGESFLRPDLPELVSIAKGMGVPFIFLTTNGTLATPDKVKAVMDAGLDSLKFSINSGENDRGAFENMRLAHEIAPGKISASTIWTGPESEPVGEKVRALGITHYFLPLYTQAEHAVNKEAYGGNSGRREAPVPIRPCWVLFTSARVDWQGRMVACCFDHAEEFVVGDVLPDPLAAWNSEKYQTLRAAHLGIERLPGRCGDCIKESHA